MTILLKQVNNKWLVKYTLKTHSITVEHDTWDDVIKELTNNIALIEKALWKMTK